MNTFLSIKKKHPDQLFNNSANDMTNTVLHLMVKSYCLIIIITEICKAPTLWLKALNKHNITHIMYIEMDTVITNLAKS